MGNWKVTSAVAVIFAFGVNGAAVAASPANIALRAQATAYCQSGITKSGDETRQGGDCG